MPHKKPTGITRVEIPTKNTFGYMVRLSRGGKRLHEFFPDAKHGGRKKAEAAAKRRHSALHAAAPAADSSHYDVLTKRNRSGKVGVRTSVSYGRPGSDTKYYAYVAFWTTNARGNYCTIGFSWNKFGKKTAYDLAAIARDEQTTDRPQIYSLYRKRTGRRIIDERMEVSHAKA